MTIPAGLAAYKLSFELSPIILTGGVAGLIPGGMLPIIAITEALNFTAGLLSGAEDINLDNCFAHFKPSAGGTFIDNQIGSYPFANQAVAANAIITQPLRISMEMTCPARGPAGFAAKLATLTALQATLASHNNNGGTYTIATPSFFYTNCIMTGMRDASGSQPSQPQSQWVMDFVKPLLTQEAALLSLNSMMERIDRSVPTSGALSGLSTTIGSPLSLAASSVAPAAFNTAGSSVTSFLPGL